MNSSQRIDELAASLYAAQHDLKNPPRDAEASIPTKSGGTYTFRYASLPALLDHIRPALEPVSLAVVQDVRADGLYTVVTHSSGQWLELGPYPLASGTDEKARGASITYARRYTLCALMRISADDADPDSAELEPPAASVTASNPAEGMGEAEAPAAAVGVPAAGAPSDKQRWMEEFHPGKPHKLRESPTVPGVRWCAQDTVGDAACPYSLQPGQVA